MGITAATQPSVLGHPARGRGGGLSLPDMLFTRTQQRVLRILFGQPGRRFHGNQIIALTNGGRGAISRELFRLEASRLITVEPEGRYKWYQANAQAAIYDELCSLIKKTVCFTAVISKALDPIRDDIVCAFIFGSIAKETETATSDIDLIVVSSRHRTGEIQLMLSPAMDELGREIDLLHYSPREFQERHKPEGNFLQRVLAEPTLFLFGSLETANELCSG